MAYDYEKLKRIPVDPNVVDRIQRSPSMRGEQGEGFLEAWGGPTQYKQFARLPMGQRVTYASILDGVTDPGAISVATGLTPEEVDNALTRLEDRGWITRR